MAGTQIVWMYYTTDGDSGYYRIKLFSSKAKAEAHAKQQNSGYGNVEAVYVE